MKFNAVSVTTRYERSHKSGSTYFVLAGDSVTLVCDTVLKKEDIRFLQWLDKEKNSSRPLFEYHFDGNNSSLLNDFDRRDIQYNFSGTEHRLTINNVSIVTDGRLYECNFRDKTNRSEEKKELDLRKIIMGKWEPSNYK